MQRNPIVDSRPVKLVVVLVYLEPKAKVQDRFDLEVDILLGSPDHVVLLKHLLHLTTFLPRYEFVEAFCLRTQTPSFIHEVQEALERGRIVLEWTSSQEKEFTFPF